MHRLRIKTKKKLKTLFFALLCLTLLYVFGAFHHLLERDFYTDFHYPFDGDLETIVHKLKSNQTPDVPPINSNHFRFAKSCPHKCRGINNIRLVYIIKSSPSNTQRRSAIRSTWGFQRRFSDVEIRTVFLIGMVESAQAQRSIDEESHKYRDIVQANYTDSYFNNTFKTLSGFEWAMKMCPQARFYAFVDDDYYLSTKNVLRFLRFPTNYPEYLKQPEAVNVRHLSGIEFDLEDDVRLYTGYAFKSSPHRHLTSKWYVSLNDWPYHMWPPYVSGGAYILSRAALQDMYYASYYTKRFKFDDIYVGILAYKTKIEPFHCEDFCFYKKPYGKWEYRYVIGSHGYGDPNEMVTVWNEQKSLGNA